jgi:hypothetical protein
MSTDNIIATGTGGAPEERTEAPDDNKICATSSYSHLVRVRLGKQERALLLGANGDDWTPLEAWKPGQREGKATLSRSISKLIRLKLIESDYGFAQGKRSTTRRDKDGVEQNYYIYYDRTRMLKLTPLGAAVVEQFRNALASGKRIRWFKTAPQLSPEQEELQTLRDLVACSQVGLEHFGRWIEEKRFVWRAAGRDTRELIDCSKAESLLEATSRDMDEWQRRIAELEAQGVTLPPVLAADANKRREPIWRQLCSRVEAAVNEVEWRLVSSDSASTTSPPAAADLADRVKNLPQA